MQYGHFEDDKREYVIDRAMEFFNALCPYCQNDKIEIRESEPCSYCQFVMGQGTEHVIRIVMGDPKVI